MSARLAAERSAATQLGRISSPPQGVTVNCVAPGAIDTVRDGAEPVHHVRNVPPVGTKGKPEEWRRSSGFLCGPGARYVTGQTIHINGGAYM